MASKGIIRLILFFLFITCQGKVSLASSILQIDSSSFKAKVNTCKRQLQRNVLDSATGSIAELKKMAILFPGDSRERNYLIYLQLQFDLELRKANYVESAKIARETLDLSLKLNDQLNIADSYYAIAFTQSKVGEWSKAAENITKALKASETLNNKRIQGKYYFFLSDIFFQLRDGKKSLFYSTKAYGLFKGENNSEFLKGRLNIILMEVLSDQYELALKHLEEVEHNIDKVKEPFQTALIHLYRSHVYHRQKKPEPSLSELNKIPHYYNFIKDNLKKVDLMLHVEMAMAETHCALQNYKEARYYFDRNIKMVLLKMDANDIKESLQLGSKIYEGIGDNLAALSYLKKFTLFSDSLNKISMNKAIHETDVKYQTTLKEKAISDQKLLLSTKDYELHKKDRYIIFGFSAIVLLLLTSFIGYLIYRNKNQSIELSLLKAQIHPHFLFNTLNNLYALSMNKSDEAPGVVLGLANILRYILYECNTVNASLKKEMDIISEYIALEKIRCKKELEVNIYIENDLQAYTIAPLLLLPLVENAYKHGANKLEMDAWINIHAKVVGNRFYFKISNNKPEEINAITSKSRYGNIGLRNIKKRLDIIYPKRHKFKITDSEDIFLVSLELEVKRRQVQYST
ncbi:histidine kinase [Pedobacter sp. B4-66]|uniref:tetratricopeptide repeat-containing sensor histidine kinase n=1 Tax=Pedobacter sp. B4-66 TaxID=2817280 RepID=UPI001BDB0A1D|nr:histidine kinase [Pedobacter sp. B4-66]